MTSPCLPVSYPYDTSEGKLWLAGDKKSPFTLACKTAHGEHLLLSNATKRNETKLESNTS